jgi:hypothetical protein
MKSIWLGKNEERKIDMTPAMEKLSEAFVLILLQSFLI